MGTIHHTFTYKSYDQLAELEAGDAALLKEARLATAMAYAPYSRFQVGAALSLEGGRIVRGGNQENASFPAGLCAERVALAAAVSGFPGVVIEALAISYDNKKGSSDHPITPCGICRQSLLEYEGMQSRPIRLVLGGLAGRIWVLESAALLLPLSFSAEDLQG